MQTVHQMGSFYKKSAWRVSSTDLEWEDARFLQENQLLRYEQCLNVALKLLREF
jgi:hypothetical protein